MPMRELSWNAMSVLHDHGQGKHQRALQRGCDDISLSGTALSCYHSALREKAWRRAWPCGALYTAILALGLMLTMLVGRLSAQAPQVGTEPASAPAVSGPLETLPTPQERLLAPVPQQFNWLAREAPSNLFLETLLGLQATLGPHCVGVAHRRGVG